MSREGLISFFVLVTICATQPLSSASHVISHLVQNADKEHSRSTGTVTQITPIDQFLTFLRRFLWSKRRRSKRFPFTIPVKVYGRTPRNQPFRDETATMVVSLCGGLLNMKPRVKLGQKILIPHIFTEEQRQ